MRQGKQDKKDPRIIKKRCSFCGHDKAWVSRSDTGRGAYITKCSRCGKTTK